MVSWVINNKNIPVVSFAFLLADITLVSFYDINSCDGGGGASKKCAFCELNTVQCNAK